MIIVNGSWQLIHGGVVAPGKFSLCAECSGRSIQVRTGYRIPWLGRFIWTGRRTTIQGADCDEVFRVGVSLVWARVADGGGPVEVFYRSGF